MATLPLAAPSRHRISVDAFHRMAEAGILAADERVELIDGELFDMSPIGALHAAIVDSLVRHFARRVHESLFIRCQNPLRLDSISEPEPDIAFVRPRRDAYTTGHPRPADVLLVIEVADTSLGYDLGTKVPLYGRHGVPEVWVIDTATRRTHRFRQPVGDRGASKASGSGYLIEEIVLPNEPLTTECLVNDAGERVCVELDQLAPPVG